MRTRRREFSIFSLSFLDIMSCGFGAVILLFLIMKHQTEVTAEPARADLDAELAALAGDLDQARAALASQAEAARRVEGDLAAAEQRAATLREAVATARAATPTSDAARRRELAERRAQLARTEADRARLVAEVADRGRAVRTYAGEGNREYLTGIQLGGARILVLVDSSASMLDASLVNVLRRRNMDTGTQRRSAKWQQALSTVDWISARFPPGSRYQIYTFDTVARPVLAGTDGQWLAVSERARLDQAVATLRERVPGGGSSLERALMVLGELRTPPDNVYLITDGLPTQGLEPPRGTTVSGQERLRLFERAVQRIPRGIPINVILLPMEGDPMAPSAYWQIARYTQGAFLSPAADWP